MATFQNIRKRLEGVLLRAKYVQSSADPEDMDLPTVLDYLERESDSWKTRDGQPWGASFNEDPGTLVNELAQMIWGKFIDGWPSVEVKGFLRKNPDISDLPVADIEKILSGEIRRPTADEMDFYRFLRSRRSGGSPYYVNNIWPFIKWPNVIHNEYDYSDIVVCGSVAALKRMKKNKAIGYRLGIDSKTVGEFLASGTDLWLDVWGEYIPLLDDSSRKYILEHKTGFEYFSKYLKLGKGCNIQVAFNLSIGMSPVQAYNLTGFPISNAFCLKAFENSIQRNEVVTLSIAEGTGLAPKDRVAQHLSRVFLKEPWLMPWFLKKGPSQFLKNRTTYAPGGREISFILADKIDEIEVVDLIKGVDTPVAAAFEGAAKRIQEKIEADASKNIVFFKDPFYSVTQKINGIEFVTNSKDLILEGDRMKHCVGSYVGACRQKESFIYKLSASTAEVDKTGRVVQHRGYSNSNPPSEDITVLGQWKEVLKKEFHETFKDWFTA